MASAIWSQSQIRPKYRKSTNNVILQVFELEHFVVGLIIHNNNVLATYEFWWITILVLHKSTDEDFESHKSLSASISWRFVSFAKALLQCTHACNCFLSPLLSSISHIEIDQIVNCQLKNNHDQSRSFPWHKIKDFQLMPKPIKTKNVIITEKWNIPCILHNEP